MIARTWRGWVRPDDAQAYTEYIERTGLADYRRTPGNRGAWMLQRQDGNRTEFITLSFWDSYDAVAAFAGEDISRARFYPEDDRYLIDREWTVMHYEIVSGDAAQPTAGARSASRTAVDSSVLASVGYDRSSLVLGLELRTGKVYQYFDVPESEFDGLMRAESIGRYYNERIRDRYRCVQA